MNKHLGTAPIRARGEITIPIGVRKILQLKPGDKISWNVEQGKVIILREKTIQEDFDVK